MANRREDTPIRQGAPRLGDAIESALSAVGITSERVSRWLGRPCRCPERVEKLNQLSAWAYRVMGGRVDNAVEYLDRMMDEERKP